MALLAIETSASLCGVALAIDGRVIWERNEPMERTHSAYVLPFIAEALADTGLSDTDIEAVAVSNGPGSFTGIRIGVATVKGLALAWNVPVIPVGSLLVLAKNARPGSTVCPVIDARRGLYYSGLFRHCPDGKLTAIVAAGGYSAPEIAAFIEDSVSGDPSSEVILLGDGAERVSTGPGVMVLPVEDWLPRAGNLAILGYGRFVAGETVSAGEVLPVYMRRSEAEEKYAKKTPGEGAH